MQNETKIAAIDNDFVNKLVECKLNDETLLQRIKTILFELNLSTVMHPLVYEKELLIKKKRAALFFERQIIHKMEFSEILQEDPERINYYIYLVGVLYEKLTGTVLPVFGEEVLTYWAYRENLGEIHSVTMCVVCGYGVFLSDDGDSKILREKLRDDSIATIDVYDRKELVEKHLQEGETIIPRTERRQLAHSL